MSTPRQLRFRPGLVKGTTEGVIADLWFEGDKVTGVDLIPILIVEEHRPILLDADSGYHVLERIWTASDEVRRWS
ncbi:MAG: hypothetical protein R3A46_05390 [Thermomicrobiales bacterium]